MHAQAASGGPPILTGVAGTDERVTETLAPLIAQFPNLRRLGRPEEFAGFAAHIAENSYINSAALRIDTGYTIQL
jgi:NAD(P)-dependent dehydrogenase (short-subunit alcohol dehydrogenase family)